MSLVDVAARGGETGATVVKALADGSTSSALMKLEIEGEDGFYPVPGSVLRLSRCRQHSWGPRPFLHNAPSARAMIIRKYDRFKTVASSSADWSRVHENSIFNNARYFWNSSKSCRSCL